MAIKIKSKLKKARIVKIQFVYLSMKDKEIIIIKARKLDIAYSTISKMLHDTIFKVRPSTKCVTPTDGHQEGATD